MHGRTSVLCSRWLQPAAVLSIVRDLIASSDICTVARAVLSPSARRHKEDRNEYCYVMDYDRRTASEIGGMWVQILCVILVVMWPARREDCKWLMRTFVKQLVCDTDK